jgi:hypothetical protein
LNPIGLYSGRDKSYLEDMTWTLTIIGTSEDILPGVTRKVILKSDRESYGTLPVGVYTCSYFLTLIWPSILDCYYSEQLRADYIRGQVYQGAGVNLIKE